VKLVRRGKARVLRMVMEMVATKLAIAGEEAIRGREVRLISVVGPVELASQGGVGQVALRLWWRGARGAYLLWTDLVLLRSSWQRPALLRQKGAR
jgi:hypothetical protein